MLTIPLIIFAHKSYNSHITIITLLLVAPLKGGLLLNADLQLSAYHLCSQLSFRAAIVAMHLPAVFSAYPRPRVAGVSISSPRGARKN